MSLLDRLRRLREIFKPAAKRDPYAGTYGSGSGGGFAGAAVGRLTASLATWSGSANSDLDAALSIMRARGRQLAANNEYGRRFLSLVASNIVGPCGPMLQVRATMASPDPKGAPVLDKVANDAIELHWAKWCRAADITGRTDFAHLCRIVVKAVARDGEALVRLVRRADLPYGIALQLLEADRLDDQYNFVFPGGGAIRQSVEIDSTGRPVALHLRVAHPGERYAGSPPAYERVPLTQIRHVYLQERAEQVRGYTWFHAIILRAMQLHEFNDAAVIAARIGASKVAALQRADDAPPGAMESLASAQVPAGAGAGAGAGALHFNVEAGEMFELPPGYTLAEWNPEYPHANYESFVNTALRGLSMGLDVAAHNLSGNMADVNFSSARIAEWGERELWMGLQQWFNRQLPEWAFGEWLATALLRGDITFPQSGKSLPADKLTKFLEAARFQGRRWRGIQPDKEIAYAKDAVALGITSRHRLAAEQGEDFEDILSELQQEREMLIAAGMSPDVPAAAPAAAQPAPQE